MITNKKIYALGIGHNTPVFIELAEACGYEIVGLYHYNDEKTGEIDHGFKIIGSFNDLFNKGNLEDMQFLLTMGDNKIRSEICDKLLSLGGSIPSLVHPMSIISRFASISSVGVYVNAFSTIQADTVVGDNTIILTGVNISHSNRIGRNCFFAGGSTLGAYTNVEDNVFFGQGALSISGKVNKIETNAYIAARALITSNVLEGQIMMGSPAKPKS